MTPKQERTILHLKADLARLKIGLESAKNKKFKYVQKDTQKSELLNFLKIGGGAIGLANGLTIGRILLGSTFSMLKWRSRLKIGSLFLVYKLFSKSFKRLIFRNK